MTEVAAWADRPDRGVRPLVAATIKAARAYGRPDLADRLEARQAGTTEARVLVVGEFKQGKSSLINALVNVDVCPIDDVLTTSVPTLVRFADVAFASAWAPASGDDEPTVRALPVADVETAALGIDDDRSFAYLEVGVPRKLLAGGLVLVDTPGAGASQSALGGAATALARLAAGLLFVTDASQELTASELAMLAAVTAACPATACVVTKIDLYPEWRRIADLDRSHLAAAGLSVPVLGTSAPLRVRAASAADRDLNAESGYPALVRWLRTHVLADAVRSGEEGTVRDIRWVLAQLEAAFLASRDVMGSAASSASAIEELRKAHGASGRLRNENARWQAALSDGCTDLAVEVEHRLRDQLRNLAREAEDAIEAGDPAEKADEFAAWVTVRAGTAVTEAHALLAERAESVATAVAAEFGVDASRVIAALPRDAEDRSLPSDHGATVSPAKAGIAQAGLTTLRGSYVGVVMVNLFGGLAGLTAVMPLALAAGALLGGRSLREERARQVSRRRQEAKAELRRYLEDVRFQAANDLQTEVRHVQRTLRDGFIGIADELRRSASDAVAAADAAIRTSEAEARTRARDVEAELQRIRALRTRVDRYAARQQALAEP